MTTLIPHPELRAFTRAAAPLLDDSQARDGGARPLRTRSGAGLEFLDHRDYQAGDELRRIDWRQTARQQRTIVRQYQREASTDWYICVDLSSSMAQQESNKAQLASQCAAAMGYLLLETGCRVGILQFADRVVGACRPGRGVTHYLRLDELAQRNAAAATGAGSQLGSCVRRIERGATAFVISDFLNRDTMRADLAALYARCTNVHALHLSAVSEHRLGHVGHVTLTDRESAETLDAIASADLERKSQQVALQMRNSLQEFCRARALRFSAWDSTRHWRSVLLGHLSATRRS